MTLKKDFYYPEICPVSISSLKKKYCKDKHTPRKKMSLSEYWNFCHSFWVSFSIALCRSRGVASQPSDGFPDVLTFKVCLNFQRKLNGKGGQWQDCWLLTVARCSPQCSKTWQGAFTRYLESCDANKFLHNWKLSYGVKREARYCLSQPPGLKLNEI